MTASDTTEGQRELWNRVRARIKTAVGVDVFTSWFAALELEEVVDDVVHLSAPTRFLCSWVLSNYSDLLLETFRQDFDDVARVQVTLRVNGQARPRLTPAVVAARLSVSLRHLQRAFENADQSVAHAIARRRAESAALMLVSPTASGHTMQQIAHDCGFSSAFELRAAFREHYAMLPSEYRNDARTPALALEPG